MISDDRCPGEMGAVVGHRRRISDPPVIVAIPEMWLQVMDVAVTTRSDFTIVMRFPDWNEAIYADALRSIISKHPDIIRRHQYVCRAFI